MVKRVISLLVVTVMLLGLLAACTDDGVLSVDDAKKVVLQDLGTKESNVDSIDVHITTVDSTACYAVYVSIGNEHWEYIVNSLTGEILSKEETDSGHSH